MRRTRQRDVILALNLLSFSSQGGERSSSRQAYGHVLALLQDMDMNIPSALLQCPAPAPAAEEAAQVFKAKKKAVEGGRNAPPGVGSGEAAFFVEGGPGLGGSGGPGVAGGGAASAAFFGPGLGEVITAAIEHMRASTALHTAVFRMINQRRMRGSTCP